MIFTSIPRFINTKFPKSNFTEQHFIYHITPDVFVMKLSYMLLKQLVRQEKLCHCVFNVVEFTTIETKGESMKAGEI